MGGVETSDEKGTQPSITFHKSQEQERNYFTQRRPFGALHIRTSAARGRQALAWEEEMGRIVEAG